MDKYIIKITYNDDQWSWEYADWKDELCEDFDANIVFYGNKDYNDHTDAGWWQDAEKLVDTFDNYYFSNVADFVAYFEDTYAEDKLEDVYTLLESWDGRDRTAFIMKIAMNLYPGLKLRHDVIRGNCQGDWQEVVYIDDPDLYFYSIDGGNNEFIQQLSDWYFGDTYNINIYYIDEDTIEDEEDDDPTAPLDYYDEDDYEDAEDIDFMTVTFTTLWKMKNTGWASALNLPARAEIIVQDES